MKKIIIDCDKKPKIPYKGWTIESHKKGGKLEWNPDEIELYLDPAQKGGYIEGNDLRKKLDGVTVLNACVLDYLLKHQELIPEEWKEKYVYFWGTIFRHAGGRLFVEYLDWNGGGWSWLCSWLGHDWSDFSPVASLMSMPSGTKSLGTDLDSLTLRISALEKKVEKILKQP